MSHQTPQIGEWYLDIVTDTVFEVVAVDDHHNTLEIQYDSGDIDEMDLEQWSPNRYEISCAPDDAGATYGMSDDEDWDEAEPNGGLYGGASNRFELDQYQDFDDFI